LAINWVGRQDGRTVLVAGPLVLYSGDRTQVPEGLLGAARAGMAGAEPAADSLTTDPDLMGWVQMDAKIKAVGGASEEARANP